MLMTKRLWAIRNENEDERKVVVVVEVVFERQIIYITKKIDLD